MMTEMYVLHKHIANVETKEKTRSKAWPFRWVGPETCWTKLKESDKSSAAEFDETFLSLW